MDADPRAAFGPRLGRRPGERDVDPERRAWRVGARRRRASVEFDTAAVQPTLAASPSGACRAALPRRATRAAAPARRRAPRSRRPAPPRRAPRPARFSATRWPASARSTGDVVHLDAADPRLVARSAARSRARPRSATPDHSVPVTTVPAPRTREDAVDVQAQRSRSRAALDARAAARSSAPRSSSTPAPVRDDTSDDLRARQQLRAPRPPLAPGRARSVFVTATTPTSTPSAASTAACSRVWGITPSSAATTIRNRSIPVAPATIVRTKRSWPGTSTTLSTRPLGSVQRRIAERDRDPARLLLRQAVGVLDRSARARARSCRGRCGPAVPSVSGVASFGRGDRPARLTSIPRRALRRPLSAPRAPTYSIQRSSTVLPRSSYSPPSAPSRLILSANARRRRPDPRARARRRRHGLRHPRWGVPADLRRPPRQPDPPRPDAPRGGRRPRRRGLRARDRARRRRDRHVRPGRDEPRHRDRRRPDGLDPDAVHHRPGQDRAARHERLPGGGRDRHHAAARQALDRDRAGRRHRAGGRRRAADRDQRAARAGADRPARRPRQRPRPRRAPTSRTCPATARGSGPTGARSGARRTRSRPRGGPCSTRAAASSTPTRRRSCARSRR